MPHAEKAIEIKTNKVRWVHLVKPAANQLENLRIKYGFHPLDIEDCLSPAQRPKLDEYDHYLFLILTFPYYEPGERVIRASEIDFFIGPDYLITVSDGQLTTLRKFFDQCQLNDIYRQKYFSENPVVLLYEIINRLQLYCYPILDHIGVDIDNIQNVIFHGEEKKMVKEILINKRNLVNFRKIMQAHKNVIRKLLSKKDKYFIPHVTTIYFNNLLEQTKDIWDILDNLNETINALHSTNESLISFRLNDIMKILTIITVTLMPISLVADIFSMRFSNMPLIARPIGFTIVIFLMLGISIGFIAYFKKKKIL